MKKLFVTLGTLICLNTFAYDDLMLSCVGEGTKTESSKINLKKEGSISSGISGSLRKKENFDAVVTVLFSEKGSWIQVPSSLTSGLNRMSNAFKKDKKSKWDMYNVKVSDEEFKGTFKLNIANRPQVVVNRFSATIIIDGLGSGFNGKCSKIDNTKQQF